MLLLRYCSNSSNIGTSNSNSSNSSNIATSNSNWYSNSSNIGTSNSNSSNAIVATLVPVANYSNLYQQQQRAGTNVATIAIVATLVPMLQQQQHQCSYIGTSNAVAGTQCCYYCVTATATSYSNAIVATLVPATATVAIVATLVPMQQQLQHWYQLQ